ncbi:hypothetical protein Q4Q35_11915 [Flavivirga aquimarina]|uniref:Uncharacterized protein n=1 Tax=Flavivirga aquimarina TaxID=2027862 RepID=A0ABT8WBI4_9FLAO|nr:hypothetical protein [Flavivirga aquimarina]MDO5970513.1 hypothetical protein [Flavivirga aquimarina]
MSNQIQFIGYGIHTGLKEENGNKTFLGLDTEILTRSQGEEKDYKARIALLKEALNKAKNRSDIEKDALKLFTVPDFYFKGKRKGYLQDTFFGSPEGKTGIIHELQDLVKGDEWKNWILIIGANLVYTLPCKKKEIAVNRIKIPFFKPKNSKEATFKKPVNLKNLTVVDAINLEILTTKLKEAFEAEDKIKKEIDNIDALASEVAYNLIEDPTITGYENNSALKVVSTIAKKINKEVDTLLKKIKTEEQAEELEAQYPYEWEKALDPGGEADIFYTSLVIKGGHATPEGALEGTEIIMKPYYDNIASSTEDTAEAPDKELVEGYKKKDEKYVLSDLVSEAPDEVDDEYIDPWQLIGLDGALNEAKIARIKKNKKYGSPLLDGWSGKTTNPIHLDVNSNGIFKIGDFTLALDSGIDNINQIKKKLILAMKSSTIKSISDKILSEEEQQLFKDIIKGVHIHVITSCGSEIYNKSAVAKKGGWVFNCDGLGSMRHWEEGKLHFNDRNFIEDKLGYRNVCLNEKTGLGNAHTGLMRMTSLSMQQDVESTLIPYGKKAKIERSSVTELDVQYVTVNSEKIKVSDLFWNGISEQLEVTNEGGASVTVTNDGPIGGSIIVYDEIIINK